MSFGSKEQRNIPDPMVASIPWI